MNANDTNGYNKFILFIMLLLLAFMFFLLYYYNFSSVVSSQIANLDYKDKVSLNPQPTCEKLNNSDQYLLSDYYIASSANSICGGNLKYDYVSLDILRLVLQAGARYIEIPICPANLQHGAHPVVATGELTGTWTTSLNSLALLDVLNVIKDISFVSTNYPLFINFKLYTKDIETLNQLASDIKHILAKRLINPINYRNVPITMERMCKLLDKVIILCSDDYIQSKMNEIVCPTFGYWQRIYFNDVSNYNVSTSRSHTLSRTEQKAATTYFQEKYPNVSSVIGKTDFLAELKSDHKILDVLSNYNKIGGSVVLPNNETDTTPSNYDPQNSWDFGCTFVAMNYQTNDSHMNKYLQFFSEGSFVLKPSGMQFYRPPAQTIDIDSLVPSLSTKKIPIIRDFVSRYGSQLSALSVYTSSNYYITIKGKNLAVRQISQLADADIASGFIIVPCPVSKYDGAIMIQSAAYPDMYLMPTETTVYLNMLDTSDSNAIATASYYPVPGKCGDSDYISFQTVIGDTTGIDRYIAVVKGVLVVLNDDPQRGTRAQMCFRIMEIPSYKTVIISSYNTKYIYSEHDGNLYLEDTERPQDDPAFKFIMSPGKQQGTITLQSQAFGKYLLVQYDDKVLANGENNKDPAAQLTLKDLGTGIVVIQDYLGRCLVGNSEGLLSLEYDKPLLQQESRDANGVLLQPAIYGPSLGVLKTFRLYPQYHVLSQS